MIVPVRRLVGIDLGRVAMPDVDLHAGERGAAARDHVDALYVDHRVVSDRTVDSHVKNLRRKLADSGVDPIASVYGVGYRFEWPEAPPG
jgi:hypothetical protein